MSEMYLQSQNCCVKSCENNLTLSEFIEKGELSTELIADWLRTICEIRNFEDKVYELLRTGVIRGASHLYAGEEAVAVGVITAIEKGDIIGSTHRGHGHCGAIGNKYAENEQQRQQHWNKMMAEVMGKETGYCKGRGGSMHIADVEKCNNLGSTGIVAGNIPVAVGAALAEKYKKTERIVVSFFGDGAVNTGSFHEAVNMASAMHLPFLGVIENNLYGISVPFSGSIVEGTTRAANIEHAAQRALAYGINGVIVDGQNVLAVYKAAKEAIEYIRKNNEPVLLEAKTYRWYGHNISDPRRYRTRKEEQKWKERDPITVLTDMMIKENLFNEEQIAAIKKQTEKAILDATEFALNSPYPDTAKLGDDVYVLESHETSVYRNDRENSEKTRLLLSEVKDRLNQKGINKSQLIAGINEEYGSRHGFVLRTIVQAVVEAQEEEMVRDKNVILLGEDVGVHEGVYGTSRGLLKKFGNERVIDTAISEAAITGAGIGAALRGLRPISEIMYVDFISIALDQLVHSGAYGRYMFGGNRKIPMVLRSGGGPGKCMAAQHSESLEPWLVYIPGLMVVMPSNPYDAKGLLKAAIRSDNLVVFIEHNSTYSQLGFVPVEDYIIPLGVGDIKRDGGDVTIVTYSRMVDFALAAAETLNHEYKIDAEVVDLRTLKPMDIKLVAESVRKTGRLVTVSEAFPQCGIGREIVGQLCEYTFPNGKSGFDCLKAKPINIAAADVPVPMSAPLEIASLPSVEKIIAAVRNILIS